MQRMASPLWSPSPERAAHSNLRWWMTALRGKYPEIGEDFASFHRWSCTHLEQFWEAAWLDANVAVSQPHRAVLTDRAMPPNRDVPNEVWFAGVRFNFAQHLLRYRDDRVALIAEAEGQPRRTVT